MNKFLAIALTTLAVGPIVHPPVARAAEKPATYCRTPNVADAGYILTVAKDEKTAVLSEETFAGQQLVAELDCEALPSRQHPDSLDNYLVCSAARTDAGIVVRLFAGGIGGLHYASVRNTTVLRGHVIERETEFGHLECRIPQ